MVLFKKWKKSRPRSGRLFRLSSPRRETGAVPQIDVHVKMNPVMSVTYIDFMYSAVHLYSTHTHSFDAGAWTDLIPLLLLGDNTPASFSLIQRRRCEISRHSSDGRKVVLIRCPSPSFACNAAAINTVKRSTILLHYAHLRGSVGCAA